VNKLVATQLIEIYKKAPVTWKEWSGWMAAILHLTTPAG